LKDNDVDNLVGQRCARCAGGFSLIEIIVVVMILAIAAVVAVPIFSSAASMQIHSASNMIAADMEYAQSLAISRQQSYAVVFDPANESYQIQDQHGSVIEHPVKKGFSYVVDFKNDSRLNRVDIVDVSFDSTSKIEFDYLGSPWNGAMGQLNNGSITLQAGSITITLNVEPLTGFLTIQ